MGRGKHIGGRKRSPLLFGITFRAILIVAAAAMFLSYISVYVNPSKFALPLFFGLYFIPILAINLFLLMLALLRRSASAWITVAALLPALLYTDLFFKIGHNEKVGTEGIRLKIESWNVGMFSSSEEGLGREECRHRIAAHLAETAPDIICMQEFFAEDKLQADTIFSSWPHRHYHLFKARNGKLFGNVILSKFPISGSGRISFPNSTNLSIFADVEHYGRTLRIYNNHLESYDVSFTALAHKFAGRMRSSSLNLREGSLGTDRYSGRQKTADNPAVQKASAMEEPTGKIHRETLREEITHDIVETHGKMKNTFIKRSQQVDRILEDINRSSTPAIICGDFNDTPMSYTYHTLAKNRKDTFEEAGRGFGGTFIPVWPLLRIDYILAPSDAGCSEHNILREPLSDHYPITATVVL
ncbi:MAG: endonuclease/exonuclease/phosphatase family protein [Bacteroidales bacterium]|nr:endonuclease/exonuclease/phosphatase family protein [Bacteroidales bacterium]